MTEFVELEAQDGIRMTWNVVPGTKTESAACVIPVAAVYTPLKPLPNNPTLPYAPLRCRTCRSVLNPYCTVDFVAKIWACPFCYQRNHFPQDYASISEQNLPGELFPSFSTIEYEALDAVGGAVPTVFLFVVDTCLIEEELGFLKLALIQAVDLLPDRSLVGLITYGTFVHVHELGFGTMPKSFVFLGGKEVSKEQILEQMSFFGPGKRPPPGGIAGPRDGLPPDSIRRFLVPTAECEFAFNSVLEELQKDPWSVPADQRASRCTGTALNVAACLLGACVPGSGARIMAFIGGPSTEGPGADVSNEEGGTRNTLCIQVRCNVCRLSRFLKMLSTKQRASLEDTAFGPLLTLPELVVSQNLMRELVTRWSVEKQAFLIGSHYVKFSLKDVALILGLRVVGIEHGNEKSLNNTHDILKGLFKGKRVVRRHDLELTLRKYNDDAHLEEHTRLVLLYIIATVLIPRSNFSVSPHFIASVKDLSIFKNIAWGKLVHQFLLKSICSTCERLVDYTKCDVACQASEELRTERKASAESTPKTIFLNGCAIALQIWAFEHIPMLRPPSVVNFPRILKYKHLIDQSEEHSILRETIDFRPFQGLHDLDVTEVLCPTRLELNEVVIREVFGEDMCEIDVSSNMDIGGNNLHHQAPIMRRLKKLEEAMGSQEVAMRNIDSKITSLSNLLKKQNRLLHKFAGKSMNGNAAKECELEPDHVRHDRSSLGPQRSPKSGADDVLEGRVVPNEERQVEVVEARNDMHPGGAPNYSQLKHQQVIPQVIPGCIQQNLTKLHWEDAKMCSLANQETLQRGRPDHKEYGSDSACEISKGRMTINMSVEEREQSNPVEVEGHPSEVEKIMEEYIDLLCRQHYFSHEDQDRRLRCIFPSIYFMKMIKSRSDGALLQLDTGNIGYSFKKCDKMFIPSKWDDNTWVLYVLNIQERKFEFFNSLNRTDHCLDDLNYLVKFFKQNFNFNMFGWRWEHLAHIWPEGTGGESGIVVLKCIDNLSQGLSHVFNQTEVADFTRKVMGVIQHSREK